MSVRCSAFLAALLCLGLLPTRAQAGSARYLCEGGLMLQADLTPRAGRVLVGETWWAVNRLRAPEVRYRDAKGLVTFSPVGRLATWQEGSGPALKCELVQPDFVHKF